MAQFEIEIKLPLKNLKETLKFLTDQGFQETAQIQEEDTYFNSVYHDVKKRDEALRIRTSTDCRSGISKTQINFKGPKLDKISMSRMELETEVSDAEVLKNILIHLDFSPVASVIKTRKYNYNMKALIGKKAPEFHAPAVVNGNEIIEDFSLEQ